ncbi:MAG: (d)CMP kinase [Lachnospiraceae bacterium]|nr:(d)CMP kinase [Lachnospiraceae bacterium]
MNIAIDGPAGAGKSTIAKKVAKDLGYIYVDTGAMYRAMALCFIKAGLDLKDEEAISGRCDDINIELKYVDGAQQVILNGENVTGEIRAEEVGNGASVTSAYKKVREKLVALQRELAKKEDVVMDGRDIGTAVLPNAELKVYLTASSLIRAKRRALELEQKGEKADLETIQRDIEDRDHRDMTRAISPLVQAEDAILVDSSDMGIEEVVETIKKLAEERR